MGSGAAQLTIVKLFASVSFSCFLRKTERLGAAADVLGPSRLTTEAREAAGRRAARLRSACILT